MEDSANQDKSFKRLILALLQSVLYLGLLLTTIRLMNLVIGLICPNSFPEGPLGATISELLLLAAAVGLIFAFLRRRFSQFAADLGLKHPKAIVELLLGFALGTVIVATMFGAMSLCGAYLVERVNWGVDIFPTLAVYLLAGFTEELIFRGFILRLLEKAGNLPFAIIVSSILFGFAHILNPCSQTQSIYYMIYACTLLSFEAGLPLSGAYLLTRRLWLPVGFHWAWNFLEGTVFGVTVSGTTPMPSLLTAIVRGDQFASGGAFGPEASLPFFVVGVLSGAGLIYWSYKRGNWRISSACQTDAAQVSQTDP